MSHIFRRAPSPLCLSLIGGLLLGGGHSPLGPTLLAFALAALGATVAKERGWPYLLLLALVVPLGGLPLLQGP